MFTCTYVCVYCRSVYVVVCDPSTPRDELNPIENNTILKMISCEGNSWVTLEMPVNNKIYFYKIHILGSVILILLYRRTHLKSKLLLAMRMLLIRKHCNRHCRIRHWMLVVRIWLVLYLWMNIRVKHGTTYIR